jgi:general secretion pathway protein E
MHAQTLADKTGKAPEHPPLPLWARRAAELGLRVADSLPDSLPEGAATLIDASLAREFSVVPLGRGADGRLTIATASAERTLERSAELEYALGAVEIVAAEPDAVHALLARHYAAQTIPVLPVPQFDARTSEIEGAYACQPGIAAYVDSVLAYAVSLGASDAHFEPAGDAFRVRLRVDGVLRTLPTLPATAGPAVIARLKVLAGLDLGTSRRAQDGRIKSGPGEGIDLRLATLPTVAGECAVLRLLDGSRHGKTLSELGMPDACREALAAVCRGHGLVLACGPTGSGKTTTLHAALRALDASERKILTVEDPVEYELPGAVQVQVRPEIGLDFSRALRSFLRHDPDVMLVGEIRDGETARIALRAALTGHLVLASLHCQDVVQAPLRLIELGLEPWLVGSALELAIAQRLVRRVCTACKGAGCEKCGGTGFNGRAAIFEWLRMDAALGGMLDKGRIAAYMESARSRLPVTMARAGLELVQRGATTRAELVAQVDLVE